MAGVLGNLWGRKGGGGEDKCRWGRSTRLRRAGHKWEGVGSYGRQVLTDWLIIVVATNQH